MTEAESMMVAVVSSQFRAMTLTVLSLTSAFPLKGGVEEDIKRGLVKLEARTEERSGGGTSWMFLEFLIVPKATMEAEETNTSELAQVSRIDNSTPPFVQAPVCMQPRFLLEKNLFHTRSLFSTSYSSFTKIYMGRIIYFHVFFLLF